MELRSGRRLRSSGRAMELRSGRLLCSTQQQQVRSLEDLGPDHISALPDDLLLLILARLRCVVTAARTGILSRRWRNLWTLLSALVFRNVKYSSLEPALACLVSPAAISLLDIHIPLMRRRRDHWERWHGSVVDVYLDAAGVTSLLLAAARLEPEELVFAINSNVTGSHVEVPYFRRAASITLKSNTFITPFHMPAGVEFAALDTLSLSCSITGLDDLISRCPRLRVLRLKVSTKNNLVIVHSTSLQELFVDSRGRTDRLDIAAPVLRQLTVSLNPYVGINVSVLAPIVEMISWYCCYVDASVPIGFGGWRLIKLMLKMAARQGQLPSLRIHADICSSCFPGQLANFKREIKKHMVAVFSDLELHLTTGGHVFGAFVFHLIGMNRIRRAVRRLKVILGGSKVKEECPKNCLCHPRDWEVQTITLIALEEVEIDGFEGVDHEVDFLKLVCKSAPMLKRVIVKLSHEDSSSTKICTELYDLFRAYSSIECCICL
ncbi:hypothetical protein ACQ4PT_065052 [Festuca glaucescens]